jgi:hypothetical protein
MIPGISLIGDATFNFNSDDSSTTDIDESARVPGMFNGAEGTYRCTANAGCTVAVEDGEISATNGWTFIPGDGVTVDVAQTDHLYFGYWLEVTEGDDGSSFRVQAFSGGDPEFTAGDMQDVTGDATYTGGAGGMYVRKVFGSGGTVESATGGDFVADVVLNVNFGGEMIGTANQYKIDGTMSSFMSDGGPLDGWNVTLEKDFADNENSFVDGTAMSTGAKASTTEGVWSGMFYGSSVDVDHDDDPDTADITPQPTGIAGEFNAHFSDGHVVGAYGASRP